MDDSGGFRKEDQPEPRRDRKTREFALDRLLRASFGVFARFGYRKASMEEVARAAQLSRQALYLHFTTKEALFRETVRYILDVALAEAGAGLAQESLPLEERLLAAFDAWVGRHVGAYGGDVADLQTASHELLGSVIPEGEARFLALITEALSRSSWRAPLAHVDVSPSQAADTLFATARGLKSLSKTREEFVSRFQSAIKIMSLGACGRP